MVTDTVMFGPFLRRSCPGPTPTCSPSLRQFNLRQVAFCLLILQVELKVIGKEVEGALRTWVVLPREALQLPNGQPGAHPASAGDRPTARTTVSLLALPGPRGVERLTDSHSSGPGYPANYCGPGPGGQYIPGTRTSSITVPMNSCSSSVAMPSSASDRASPAIRVAPKASAKASKTLGAGGSLQDLKRILRRYVGELARHL